MATDRVLSIQSHVSYGYVGGKAAVFPLQCLGFDVDIINSVNFSNHSGYGRLGGTRTTAAELKSIFDGLKQNELLTQKRLVTGYVPGAEGLSAVRDLVRALKETEPELIYVLDPVMGDAGRLYVAPDVIPVYREMLSLATVITPNWFEVETLTGVEMKDTQSLQKAFKTLHEEYNCPNVVMSSIPLKPWLADILPPSIRPDPEMESPSGEYLLCIASSTDNATATGETSTIYAQCVPFISGYFSGVGDIFSALLLGHYLTKNVEATSETALPVAVSHALTKTHAILIRTHEHALTLPEDDLHATDDEKDLFEPLRKTRRMRGRELRVIQSQDIIRQQLQPQGAAIEVWENFWSL
ncbi:Ribokinase-like protein [Pleurotus eryngii]|uniref:pyridoxal kinase n=1 Tax=Pleurotus eryngii TaxID=5323 RepID=A0A9P6A401_PLEER|nr:Ribokinase-like protein [Pleurotus eryngii]